MKIKDYSPIGHIDFFDGTRVPVVKATEVRCDVFKQVINFIAVDGEIYQYQKNAEKYSTTYVCKFYKFDHKNCWFEPTKDVKIVEIYYKYGAVCYTPTLESPKSEWVRTSPEPALIWPNSKTLWVAADKYENLKKDFAIVCGALKKLQKHSVFVTYTKMMQDSDGDRIPTCHTNYLLKGRGIDDQDTVHLLKEAFNIAENEDTPDNTLRKLYYNIHNYHVLQKKYDVLLEENKKLKDELTATNDANYVINKNIAELKQQYKTLREKHDAVCKERYELSKEYEELLKEYENITKFTVLPRIAMRSEECTELRKKNKDLENHNDALKADNEKHILTIAELKKEVSALQQENSTLVASRNFYKSSKGTMEFSLSGQIAGLRLANDRLKAELTIAKDANNTIKEKCVELEKHNYLLNDELTYQRGKVDVLLQERQHYINKNKRYAETLSIIDSNLGWSPRRDNDGTPYYYASSLILAKDINKIKQTMQEVKSEKND